MSKLYPSPAYSLGLDLAIDATLRQVEDENGTGSALYLATGSAKIAGTFETTGAATLASIVCTAGATFGGGYGSTGCTISTAGVGQFNGALTTDGALTADSAAIGGGYGSTGVSVSNAGVIQANGAITTDGALTADSAAIGGGYGSTGASISNAGVGQFNGALTTDGTLTAADAAIGGGYGSSGVTISGAGAISADALGTFSVLGENAAAEALRLYNPDDPASGETGQGVNLTFYLDGTTDNGASYAAHEAASVRVGKVADWFGTGGDDSDYDAYMAFYLTVNGTETEYFRISSLASVGGAVTTGSLTASYFASGSGGMRLGNASVELKDAFDISWSSDGTYYGSKDLNISRAAAGVLAVDDGGGDGAGDGKVKAAQYQNTGTQLTAGAAVTESVDGVLKTAVWKGQIDYSDINALGAVTSGDITIVTLPAKTILHAAYLVVDTQGAFDDTLTLTLGSAGAAYNQVLLTADAKAAANTVYGDADGERGTDLPDADHLGSKLYSYTTTQALTAHVDGNLTNLNHASLNAGAWSYILVYSVLA